MLTTAILALCLVLCVGAQTRSSRQTRTNKTVPYLDGRIVGGKLAAIEAFPYQVSLHSNGRHICGGSLIKTQVVVTAAHCLSMRPVESLRIQAGSIRTNQGGVLIPVKEVIVHPEFDSNSLDMDVGIVILAEPVVYSYKILPVQLASPEDSLTEGSALIISGWGATYEGSFPTTSLRYTEVNLIDQEICSLYYKGSGSITNNMFCAGVKEGGRDSCQGDSGGPLVVYGDSQAKLYGIVSWGYGCARPMFPGVYTKVANMYPWIMETLKSRILNNTLTGKIKV